MKIENIKELAKVIALCRKQGVLAIKIDGIELQLSPTVNQVRAPQLTDFSNDFPEAQVQVPKYSPIADASPDSVDMPDELSEEQLMFYSSQGHTEQ